MNELPHNLDAEEYVLGAAMLEPKAADRLLGLLEPGHFYFRERNGFVFEAIRSLRDEGKNAVPGLVAAALEERGVLEQVGGKARLHELVVGTPAASNAPHFASLVKESWAKRGLLTGLSRATAAASNGTTTRKALEVAEDEILKARAMLDKGRQSVMTSTELVSSFRDHLANPPDPKDGVQTPFSFLRRMSGGRLYVLGGYTADGKTATALQFLKAAAKEGAHVGFVSVEMAWADVRDRLITSYGVPSLEVESGRISNEYRGALGRALEDIGSMRFSVIDDEQVNPTSLARYQRMKRYDLLIIDHLHRFAWSERRDLEQAVTAITNLARSENIPVLLLAQLQRGRGHEQFPRPTMASVRETGMIEAEAACMWFIWRKRDDNNVPTGEAEFIVAKNRFGPTGRKPLQFRDGEVRFVELERVAA